MTGLEASRLRPRVGRPIPFKDKAMHRMNRKTTPSHWRQATAKEPLAADAQLLQHRAGIPRGRSSPIRSRLPTRVKEAGCCTIPPTAAGLERIVDRPECRPIGARPLELRRLAPAGRRRCLRPGKSSKRLVFAVGIIGSIERSSSDWACRARNSATMSFTANSRTRQSVRISYCTYSCTNLGIITIE